MSDYQLQAESEVWDSIAGRPAPKDTRKRFLHSGRIVDGHRIDVWRINGTRLYVVSVDGRELPGLHDWTVDAINAGMEEVK